MYVYQMKLVFQLISLIFWQFNSRIALFFNKLIISTSSNTVRTTRFLLLDILHFLPSINNRMGLKIKQKIILNTNM
jgi:hypothetical protein